MGKWSEQKLQINADGESILDLSRQHIIDKDIPELCNFLSSLSQQSSSPFTLNLQENDLTDTGAEELSEYLKTNNKIKALNIANNTNITIEGMAFLASIDSLEWINAGDFFHPKEKSVLYLKFMQLFGFNAKDGQCAGFTHYLIPKLTEPSASKEIILFNYKLHKIDLYWKEALSWCDEKNSKAKMENRLKTWHSDLLQGRKNKIDEEFKDFFKNIYEHQNKEDLSSDEKENNLAIYLKKIKTREDLQFKLNELQRTADSNKLFFTIEMDANEHSTAIAYDPINKQWSFIDSNNFPVHFVKNTEELAAKVFAAHTFSGKTQFSIYPTAYVARKNETKAQAVFQSWGTRNPFWRNNGNKILVGALIGLFVGIPIVALLAVALVSTGGLAAIPLVGTGLALIASTNIGVGAIIALGAAIPLVSSLLGAAVSAGIFKLKEKIQSFFKASPQTVQASVSIQPQSQTRANSGLMSTGYVIKNTPDTPSAKANSPIMKLQQAILKLKESNLDVELCDGIQNTNTPELHLRIMGDPINIFALKGALKENGILTEFTYKEAQQILVVNASEIALKINFSKIKTAFIEFKKQENKYFSQPSSSQIEVSKSILSPNVRKPETMSTYRSSI